MAAHSTLLAFTTDVSLALNGPREGRTVVPIADPEATITFYVHARRDWIANAPALGERLGLI